VLAPAPSDTGSVVPSAPEPEPQPEVKLLLTAEEKLERQTKQIGKIIRSAIKNNRSLGGKALKSIESVFKAIDKDGSGDLDYDEFKMAMTRLGLGLTEEQIAQCIQVLDKDGDGEVSLAEFTALVKNEIKVEAKPEPEPEPEPEPHPDPEPEPEDVGAEGAVAEPVADSSPKAVRLSARGFGTLSPRLAQQGQDDGAGLGLSLTVQPVKLPRYGENASKLAVTFVP